jgi:hypothetical protein
VECGTLGSGVQVGQKICTVSHQFKPKMELRTQCLHNFLSLHEFLTAPDTNLGSDKANSELQKAPQDLEHSKGLFIAKSSHQSPEKKSWPMTDIQLL